MKLVTLTNAFFFFSYVSMKDFLALKDDVKRLKRKVGGLDSKLTALDSDQHCSDPKKSQTGESKSVRSGLTPTKLSTPRKSETPIKSTPQLKASPESSPCKLLLQTSPLSATLYNNHTKSELQDAVDHIDQLYPAVKTLMLMLFPESYIKTHSISGKPCNSKQAAKPPFDSRLYNIMIGIIKEKYGSANKEITEKVHSIQKWAQKQKKGL